MPVQTHPNRLAILSESWPLTLYKQLLCLLKTGSVMNPEAAVHNFITSSDKPFDSFDRTTLKAFSQLLILDPTFTNSEVNNAWLSAKNTPQWLISKQKQLSKAQTILFMIRIFQACQIIFGAVIPFWLNECAVRNSNCDQAAVLLSTFNSYEPKVRGIRCADLGLNTTSAMQIIAALPTETIDGFSGLGWTKKGLISSSYSNWKNPNGIGPGLIFGFYLMLLWGSKMISDRDIILSNPRKKCLMLALGAALFTGVFMLGPAYGHTLDTDVAEAIGNDIASRYWPVNEVMKNYVTCALQAINWLITDGPGMLIDCKDTLNIGLSACHPPNLIQDYCGWLGSTTGLLFAFANAIVFYAIQAVLLLKDFHQNIADISTEIKEQTKYSIAAFRGALLPPPQTSVLDENTNQQTTLSLTLGS